LKRLAPKELELTNGKTVKIEYQVFEDKAQARVFGKIQDFFGMIEHPQVGNLPSHLIRVELLAPGGQTAQITSDLGQFWKSSYSEVKRSYLGRYPRHYWPDDPARAKPFLTKRQEQGSRLDSISKEKPSKGK
jgi:ATP-dependent helicase HrpB